MACPAIDPSAGTAIRLTQFIDCNAETIGREGFLALAGFSLSSSLLSALLTIFMAGIGYRLILGDRVGISDGVGWALRIGIVLALVTGWSAFQTLFYDLTISGPSDVSKNIMIAAGIPDAQIDIRIQQAYDSLRLGLQPYSLANSENVVPLYQVQPPLPRTATLFLLTVVGLQGASNLAAAFLLAVAPLPIMGLLFWPGIGFFFGWLRTWAATLFASAGLSVSSSLCLLAIESELARMQSLGTANAVQLDLQAPLTIIGLFLLAALAIVLVSFKLSASIATKVELGFISSRHTNLEGPAQRENNVLPAAGPSHMGRFDQELGQPDRKRVSNLTDAFERTAGRNSRPDSTWPSPAFGNHLGVDSRGSVYPNPTAPTRSQTDIGARRALGRRSRSVTRRDTRL